MWWEPVRLRGTLLLFGRLCQETFAAVNDRLVNDLLHYCFVVCMQQRMLN